MEKREQIIRDAVMHMGLVPTAQQAAVIGSLATFATSRGTRDAVIINGYAGTGKTTVTGAVVAAMNKNGLKTVLLAPTGRAAKVASSFAKGKARTIHKQIYRMIDSGNGFGPSSRNFVLGQNPNKNTIYFVDEASMVTQRNDGASLLLDLIRYVYGNGQGNAIVFIGDTAQLPPVGQPDSPAMSPETLRKIGLNPYIYHLEEPLRQSLDSGILFNATKIRRNIGKEHNTVPTLGVSNFEEVEVVSSEELADKLADSWGKVGRDETLLITRSNYRANRYNDEIRRRVLYSESPLEQSERLIISKNNYFWTREIKEVDFLANGDTVIVEWRGKPEKMYGRYFIDVELQLPGYEKPIGAKIMLRSLRSEGPAIPQDEMDRFYANVASTYEGALTEKMAAVDADPYYNSLQVKYAYAVTCHKAQGGQWKHVYIDMGGIAREAMDDSFYRWLYTAMTRATEKLYFVNPTLPTD